MLLNERGDGVGDRVRRRVGDHLVEGGGVEQGFPVHTVWQILQDCQLCLCCTGGRLGLCQLSGELFWGRLLVWGQAQGFAESVAEFGELFFELVALVAFPGEVG